MSHFYECCHPSFEDKFMGKKSSLEMTHNKRTRVAKGVFKNVY